jgi:hypothetical protein
MKKEIIIKSLEEDLAELGLLEAKLEIGARVKLVYPKDRVDSLGKYFNGKTGVVRAKEGNYWRVYLDQPVDIPEVGKVTDDLWERQFLKVVK